MRRHEIAIFCLIVGGLVVLALGIATRLDVTRSERDSLRARTEELESGIRQYIMAAAILAQRNQVLEGQLSWCLNTPLVEGR